jgi:hypothetical protein
MSKGVPRQRVEPRQGGHWPGVIPPELDQAMVLPGPGGAPTTASPHRCAPTRQPGPAHRSHPDSTGFRDDASVRVRHRPLGIMVGPLSACCRSTTTGMFPNRSRARTSAAREPLPRTPAIACQSTAACGSPIQPSWPTFVNLRPSRLRKGWTDTPWSGGACRRRVRPAGQSRPGRAQG